MNIYSYSPQKGDSISRVLTFALLGGGGLLVLLGAVFPDYEPFFWTLGFILLMAGLLVCTRFLLSGFTYNIESTADGTPPDLVIIENKGKVNRTVCRVSASGGKLFEYKKSEKRSRLSSKKIYDYRPTPFSEGAYVYEAPEQDGGGFVLFCPDKEMLSLMHSLGCEVTK